MKSNLLSLDISIPVNDIINVYYDSVEINYENLGKNLRL